MTASPGGIRSSPTHILDTIRLPFPDMEAQAHSMTMGSCSVRKEQSCICAYPELLVECMNMSQLLVMAELAMEIMQ